MTGLEIDSGDFLNPAGRGAAPGGLVRGGSTQSGGDAGSGKLRGIGLAYHLETMAGGLDEGARLTLQGDGSVHLFLGTQSSGQGHGTTYAQVVSDALGVEPNAVQLHQGDSALCPPGGGTNQSRSALMGALAIEGAAADLVEQARPLAARLLQAMEVRFEGGAFQASDTGQRVSLSDVAALAAEEGAPLEGSYCAPGAAMTYSNGCHVCELTIDPETGVVAIERYRVLSDFGRPSIPCCAGGSFRAAPFRASAKRSWSGWFTNRRAVSS